MGMVVRYTTVGSLGIATVTVIFYMLILKFRRLEHALVRLAREEIRKAEHYVEHYEQVIIAKIREEINRIEHMFSGIGDKVHKGSRAVMHGAISSATSVERAVSPVRWKQDGGATFYETD